MFQQFINKAFVLFLVILTISGCSAAVRAQAADMKIFSDRDADFSAFARTPAAQLPANLAAWHAGDGDTRDFTSVNDGRILFPNTKFIVGKIGQAFAFDYEPGIGAGGVQINSPSIFRGQTEGTIETWVRLRDLPVGRFGFSAVWAETEEFFGIRFGIFYSRSGRLAAYGNFSNVVAETPAAVPQNEWLHVAAVHKAGEPMRLYVNGTLAATSATNGAAFTDARSRFVSIGTSPTGDGDDLSLRGDVDDASVYTRALSAGEIQAIYNAGTAGKLRQTATNAGANVVNVVRDATVTFANVTTAGETAQTPLDVSTLPALPPGFAHSGLAYDISTTAVSSGNIDLCFNLPALAGANFSSLRLLHFENGVWVNRTTSVGSPQLCGRVSSLSRFVIAERFVPTASSVTVGGRVTTASGQGVVRARVTLTDAGGAVRTATTNSFGYYRFTAVPAGATYILSAGSKQYVFAPESMVLNVAEDLHNADFTAQEFYQGGFKQNGIIHKF